jgi:hypothetical protein
MSTEKTLAEYNQRHISLTINEEDEVIYSRIFLHDIVDSNFLLTSVELFELSNILKENWNEIIKYVTENYDRNRR